MDRSLRKKSLPRLALEFFFPFLHNPYGVQDMVCSRTQDMQRYWSDIFLKSLWYLISK